MVGPSALGLLARLEEPPRKVALVRAGRIGDFLCATPAFRALRAALAGAEITMITVPMLADLVERSPHLDRFAPFPGFPGIAEQLFDARQATTFFSVMQAQRFDLAIQMHGSGVYANPFTLLLGARATAGFVRQGDGAGLLDAALPIPTRGSEVRRLLALTSFLGATPQGEATEFPLLAADHAQADALLARAPRPLLGLHAGACDRARRWPPARFAAVGAALHARHGGTLVLLGDEDTTGDAAGIIALMRGAGASCLDLTGRTSLPALGAVVARLALLVTNDSGPAHLAYALGTPSVTIYGGADPEAYGPPAVGRHQLAQCALPCRPRGGRTCPTCAHGYACLQGVSVAQVLDLAERALASRISRAGGANAPDSPGFDRTRRASCDQPSGGDGMI